MSLFSSWFSYFNPWATRESPVVAPSEPVVAPSEPVVAPSEPVVAPSEPVVAPSEPVVAPSEQKKTRKKRKKDPVIKPSIDTYNYSVMPRFPKKVVLLITTHGCIPVKKEMPTTLDVPDDMKIIQITAAGLGEINNIYGVNVIKYADKIREYLNYLLISKTKEDYLNTLKPLTAHMKKLDETLMVPEIKEKIKKNPNEDYGFDRNYYYQKLDKSDYRVNIFNPGDKILNKTYNRAALDATNYDWRINTLNVPGNPDLLKWFSPRVTRAHSENEIKLSKVIKFLKIRGVKEVVIIDFSCSVFMDENNRYILNRDKRRLRYDLYRQTKKSRTSDDIESHYVGYGGKKRQKTRKHKTKK
jgi:hypothetical protein